MGIPEISVIIVNWNTAEYLRTALRSLFEYTLDVPFEVIVVDNGSFDGSKKIAVAYPNTIYVQLEMNLGFSKANNYGSQYAKGRTILFLNPDVILNCNALKVMYNFLISHSDYKAVGCQLIHPDGSIQKIAGRTFPSAWNQFCQLAMLNKVFPNSKLFATVELDYWDHKNSKNVACLSGACLLMESNEFRNLGGFDENLFMYGEDVDLCYRIGKSGGKLRYCAEASIIHLEGKSSEKREKTNFSTLLQRESNIYFMNKHFGPLSAAFFRISVAIGSSVRILIMLGLFPVGLITRNDALKRLPFRKYFALFSWSLGVKKPAILETRLQYKNAQVPKS